MMLNVSSNVDGYAATCWGSICEACQAATCTLYSHNDLACLCTSCNANIHSFNPSKMWFEHASACTEFPAVFTCNADAASLCTNCYAPLATISNTQNDHKANEQISEQFEDETDSWLLFKADKNDEQSNNEFFYDEVDQYLDLAEYDSCVENQYQDQNNTCQDQHNTQQFYSIIQENSESDSTVPLLMVGTKAQDQEQQNFFTGMGQGMSKAGFIYNPSTSQSAFVSYMDAVIQPEATTSSISYSCRRLPERKFGTQSSTALPMPSKFTPMNREAKVQRYREKRKAIRKIVKKIKHVSRKIHADTQPRVKGRFAKRT